MDPDKKKVYEEKNDNTTLRANWEENTIALFINALRVYVKCLEPFYKKGNEKIEKEIKDMRKLINYLVQIKSDEKSNWGGFIEIYFMKSTYSRLTDILNKYNSILKQIYRQKKEKILVDGALEAEEKELENLKEVLNKDPFIYDVRIKTLVPDFSSAFPETASVPTSQIGQPINIEKFYGQAVFGNNYGQVIQNNNQEFIKELQDFSTKIMESNDVTPEVKKDAIIDIQMLVAQSNKSKPDISIMQKAVKSLSVLANITQVAGFVLPHLDKIQNFINSILH